RSLEALLFDLQAAAGEAVALRDRRGIRRRGSAAHGPLGSRRLQAGVRPPARRFLTRLDAAEAPLLIEANQEIGADAPLVERLAVCATEAPGQRHIGGPAAPRYSATEAHRVEGRGRKVERRERPGRAERRLEGVADTQRKLEIGLRQAHLGAQVR